MFLKIKEKKSPAFYILFLTAGYVSFFLILLNKIISTTGLYHSIILPVISILLMFVSCLITWGIFKVIEWNRSYFWSTHLFFGFYFLISYIILRLLITQLIGFSPLLVTKVYIFLFVFLIVLGIPAAYYYLNTLFIKLKKSKEEIEVKKNELENLKNQLSPHFLFNHLNNIYATIMIDKEIALDYTHKFSDMMRFYHNMIGQEKIPIEDELSYIENYLALEKYKMGDRLRLNFTKYVDQYNYTIPPFLITPFIETAIERSQGLGALPYIDIILTIKNSSLNLEVFNSIPEKPGKVKKQILLDKIRNQLQFMCPNQFKLTLVKVNNIEQSTLEFPL